MGGATRHRLETSGRSLISGEREQRAGAVARQQNISGQLDCDHSQFFAFVFPNTFHGRTNPKGSGEVPPAVPAHNCVERLWNNKPDGRGGWGGLGPAAGWLLSLLRDKAGHWRCLLGLWGMQMMRRRHADTTKHLSVLGSDLLP